MVEWAGVPFLKPLPCRARGAVGAAWPTTASFLPALQSLDGGLISIKGVCFPTFVSG